MGKNIEDFLNKIDKRDSKITLPRRYGSISITSFWRNTSRYSSLLEFIKSLNVTTKDPTVKLLTSYIIKTVVLYDKIPTFYNKCIHTPGCRSDFKCCSDYGCCNNFCPGD